MAAADDPTPPSFWRRLMELVGVDDEVDAVTDKITRARDWVNAKLPAATPEQQARAKTFDAGMEAWRAKRGQQTQAFINSSVIDPVKRILGSAPVQGIAHQFKEDYAPLWETAPSTEALAQLGHQALDERNAPAREAMARAGIPAVVGDILNAPNDWIPHQLIDQGVQNSTPLGIATNLDLPIGPALKAAAPFVGGAAAHLAAVLPPGFYSRVERVAEQVGKKGIHPNKLASLLKSGASSEEVAYRNLPDLITRKGNQLISKEELAQHLEAHPPPEITRTVLGGALPVEQRGNQWVVQYSDGSTRTVAREDEARAIAESGTAAPKYQSYTLPGGENYRESLTQLAGADEAGMQKLVAQRDAVDAEIAAFHQARGEDRFAPHPPELVEKFNRLQQQINALPNAQYRSGHFDQPNILAHARTTERALPIEGMRSLPEIEQIIQDVAGVTRPEHLASGAPQRAVSQGLISHDEAALYGQSRGFTNYPHDPGERGRFLEEIQSDWHQAGKRSGYAQVTPEMQARAAELRPQLAAADAALHEKAVARDAATQAHINRQREHLPQYLPPEWQHLKSFDEATQAYRAPSGGGWESDPIEAWRTARDRAAATPEARAAQRASQVANAEFDRASDQYNHLNTQLRALESPKGIPDAPFKETWPDLALKQQLLDVAHRRDLSWLGFTSGGTQNERYDLAKQVSKIEYDPVERRLLAYDHDGARVIDEGVEPEEIAEHIGEGPAAKLTEQIQRHEAGRKWERDQWSVGHETTPEYFHIYDPNGEPLHTYDGALEWFKSEEAAQERIDELLNESHEATRRSAARDGDPYLPTLSGLDLQVGGEGMTSFYDQLLPARLNKLLKPFGGQVEQGTVPVPGKAPGPVTRYRVIDRSGQRGLASYQNMSQREAERAAGTLNIGYAGNPWAVVEPYQTMGEVDATVHEPAWIARLSPQMKARIRQQGFSLMSFLPPALLGGAAAASQLAGGGEDDSPTAPGRPQHWLGASFLPRPGS